MDTHVSRHLSANRHRVYQALVDPDEVKRWRYPRGTSCYVHEFEAVEDGRVRVSLTHQSGSGGTSDAGTDTVTGRFVKLVPDELVIEVDQFETGDPALLGEMTMTIRLDDAADGCTRIAVSHEGLPGGLSEEDNEEGWRDALDRLAAVLG